MKTTLNLPCSCVGGKQCGMLKISKWRGNDGDYSVSILSKDTKDRKLQRLNIYLDKRSVDIIRDFLK